MLQSEERLSVTQFTMSALKFVVLAALVAVVSCRRISGGASVEVSRRGLLLPSSIENLNAHLDISGDSSSSSGTSNSQETRPVQMRGKPGRKPGRTQLSSSTTESSQSNGFTRYWEREHHPRTQRPPRQQRVQRVMAVSSHEQESSSGEMHQVERIHHDTDPQVANNGQQKPNHISGRGGYKSRDTSRPWSAEQQTGSGLDNDLRKPYY